MASLITVIHRLLTVMFLDHSLCLSCLSTTDCLFVCCVVELRRNGRRVSVTGLNRIHRHTSTRDTEFYGEQAQKPMCGSALMLARRGSVAGETVKSVRTHASPMSVRTYAG
jgi:hypothetical protein